ncbi:hypothetical protein SPBR_04037 [Sporothrix brasiliensis 5110]|uniref:Uncharacterized protein n=1 Tax=Sporothrix brasiliensis 5110 TaxID=1398154 RepID=A0A0C2IWP8_9PEZI|nr:uncharacterized protein SPBR_04037 [Sporothrix brasiliensis 5110]KIH93571.1 hypothetical protein SPBR_04037 [Sporothrix brasiliensis 5110]
MSQSTASGQGPGPQPSITTTHVRPRDESSSSQDILKPTASPNENNSSGGDGGTIAGLNKDTCTSSVKSSKMESHPSRSPVMAGRYRIPTVSSSSSHRTHSGQSTHSGQDAPHRSSFPLPLAPPKPASLPTPTLPVQTAHTSVRSSSSSSNAHAGLRYSMDYDQGYTSGIKYTRRAHGDNSFYTNGGKNGSHSRAQQAMDDIKTEAFAAGKMHGYQTGYHEGRLVGQREGHRDGRDDGLREGRREAQKDSQRHGYNEGHRVGEEKGYAEGQKKGYAEGHAEGHEAGRSEGRESGHGEGYHAGFDEGCDQGYYEGHGHGEQRGHARGWDEGYEQGFAWASTFWTSGPLKADAQEFVPKTYTSPLVVDGSSGPGVDPTLFRSWLHDVEHRQLTRPAQADVASDQDTVQQPDTLETDQRGGIDHLVIQTDGRSAKEKVEEHHIGQPITINVGLSVDDEVEDSDLPIDSGNQQHDKKTAPVEVDDSGDDVFVTPYESPVAARVGVLDQVSDNESEADLCAGWAAAFRPRRDAPRPQVLSPSPSQTMSPASAASGTTVVHNGTREGDTVTHYITFGDVPVTITKSSAGTVAVPSWPPTAVDAPATIDATAAGVDDADASDMDSLGGQSTLVLDISDEEMPEPAEPVEAQVDVDDASVLSPTLSETEIDHRGAKGKGRGSWSHKASATSRAAAQAAPQIQMPPNPVMTFEDIAIFSSQGPNPPLPRYPSPLYRTPPLFEIGPDQAPQVTESYPSFRRRGCNTVFSAYRLEPGQIFDPLAEVHDKKGTIFPVGGRTPPRGIVKLVPDHIVYKFGIPPPDHSNETNDANDTNDTHAAPSSGAERLARCLQHGLSTCPMCAITPSFRFLGPGEAIARTFAHDGTPAGDPQTSPAVFASGQFRPAGFGDFEVHGRPLQESSLAAAQHPDEASPPCPVRMMPQYDPEVLGHHVRGVRGERNEHGEHAREKPVPPSALDTHYCDPCGGLTWLVTRRSRPHGGGSAVGTNSTNSTNNPDTVAGDRTFGRSHPSHHASFNEPWSRSRSFCASLGGRGSSRFPEQAGTTRSLFVEVASVPAEAEHRGQGRGRSEPARYGVAAFFGPHSRYNSRLDLDLATASTQVARDATGRGGREDRQERLVDLPFERFSTNAGPLAAMAVALHRLWIDVVPAHRAAVDRVTRYNSDHSRRKAYRFRAILMTDSAYVVDLFSDHLHKRWTRRFRPYDYVAPGSGNALAVSGAAAVADKPTAKKKKSGKRKSKKTKKAKKGKKEAEAEAEGAEGAEEVHKKDKKEENKDEKAAVAAVAAVGTVGAVGAASGKGIRTTVVMGAHVDSAPSDGIVAPNNDNTRIVATFDELVDMDLAAAASPTFSIPTTTPTSSRAASRSHSPPPTRTTTLKAPAVESENGPDSPDRPNGPGPGPGPGPASAPGVGLGLHVDGLFLPPASDRALDAFAFDRPDGRFVYVSAHGGPPMANGYLVQLVRRYMEMLRQHGVQVALYEVEGPYVQNARRLAEEAIA